ncbi:MAG: hypothetical protein O2816_08570 [Planctomycetota bacterium]|nr:hypothetical protein [Planctomycetota bacterium]
MLAALLLLQPALVQDPRPQPLPLVVATPLVEALPAPERFTLSAGHWVVWEGGAASNHRAPDTLLFRKHASGPEENIGSIGGRLIDVDANGTILVSGRARNHVSLVDAAGAWQHFYAPGTREGQRVEFAHIDLSGAVLMVEGEGAPTYHFRTFSSQGFGPAVALAEGTAAQITRDTFWRDEGLVAWVTEGCEVCVVDTSKGERWRHPLPGDAPYSLSGVFEGVALLAATRPSRAILLRLADGKSWSVATPAASIHAVLPEGILMNGKFWDPVTGHEYRTELPNLNSYRASIRRVGTGYHLTGHHQVWNLDLNKTSAGLPTDNAEALDRLQAGLDRSDAEQTFQAIRSLKIPLGPRELRLLEHALAAGGPNVVSRAAGILGWDGGGESMRLMIEALRALPPGYHRDRHTLAFQLAESGDPRALEALLEMPIDGFLARNDDGERLARALMIHALPGAAELLRRIRPGAVPEVDAALDAIAERPEALAVWASLR